MKTDVTQDNQLKYIHKYVPSPTGAAGSPTLLLLHGTGGDENDLLPLARMLHPNANYLSLRGNVPENGMNRFFRRLGEGVFDQADLLTRTGDLAAFVPAAGERYGFDPSRLYVVGYSNGANIGGSLLFRHANLVAGAVLLHPMVPFEPENLPDLAGKPVFIGAGRNDPIVLPENTSRLVSLLQSSGAQVTVHWHPGGHGLTRDEMEAGAHWFAERA